MIKSDTIAKLAEALCCAQGEMSGAKKDATNPFFNSKYADLAAVIEAIKEPFDKYGISYTQIAGLDDDGYVSVTTLLMHKSGEYIGGELRMKPVKADPQGIGSCITYARRYGLQAIVGIPAEDDDGNAASANKEKADVDKATSEAKSLADSAELAVTICDRLAKIDNKTELKNYVNILKGESKTAGADKKELWRAKDRLTDDDYKAVKSAINAAAARIDARLKGINNDEGGFTLAEILSLAQKKGLTRKDVEAQCMEAFKHLDIDRLKRSEAESMIDWLNGEPDAKI